ncbi:hypothetical protein AM1_G0052 (plasmid) [Acaryochloris marina MBIC11017]|uniref:Uncharacterized protein n=1 Tax=Acaryochloris marina (strain MBIC 11017) TaxID=329726 RepID=A8ZQE6_ACAM1|nr:hypothetical protein AM1_G0052 [Acaryochloris marina MBIC11017]
MAYGQLLGNPLTPFFLSLLITDGLAGLPINRVVVVITCVRCPDPPVTIFRKLSELIAVDDTDIIGFGEAKDDIATFAASSIIRAADGAMILSFERNQL